MTCVHVRVKSGAVVSADTRVVCANQQICYHSKRDAGLIKFSVDLFFVNHEYA